MEIYTVLNGDEACFIDLHRYRVASFLIPNANLLNNDDPLANKQWAKLTKRIDELEIGESMDFGDYTIILGEIDDDVFSDLLKEGT